jgi:hypothetical protein
MRDTDPILTPVYEAPKNATIMLFLGLFLLVLAFFILLVSISTVEKVKSDKVMSSLTSTFKTVLSPSLNPSTFQSLDGDLVAAANLQDEITRVFATSLRVARVEVIQPGRLMRVHLPMRAVFEDEATEVRSSMLPLFDRIVASLSARPPGLRFDMEAVINLATVAPGETAMPTEQGLAMERAGAFARTLLGRGIPPDALSVGLYPSDQPDMTLWFYVRPDNEIRGDLAAPGLSDGVGADPGAPPPLEVEIVR